MKKKAWTPKTMAAKRWKDVSPDERREIMTVISKKAAAARIAKCLERKKTEAAKINSTRKNTAKTNKNGKLSKRPIANPPSGR